MKKKGEGERDEQLHLPSVSSCIVQIKASPELSTGISTSHSLIRTFAWPPLAGRWQERQGYGKGSGQPTSRDWQTEKCLLICPSPYL